MISPQQQSQDPAQQQTQAILKFLPLMIGWFSLNVPSGLTLYWFTNNVITTAQQLYLRRGFQAAQAVVGGGGAAASGAVVDVEAEAVEKKPSGGAGGRLASGCPPLLCAALALRMKRPARGGPGVGARCACQHAAHTLAAGKELNARRSPKQLEAAAAGGDTGGRGEKFRAIKAREAAARAASQVHCCALRCLHVHFSWLKQPAAWGPWGAAERSSTHRVCSAAAGATCSSAPSSPRHTLLRCPLHRPGRAWRRLRPPLPRRLSGVPSSGL